MAAARKKYKDYSFMKFGTHDIENVPADDLIGTQHLIIASNAIHATKSLPDARVCLTRHDNLIRTLIQSSRHLMRSV